MAAITNSLKNISIASLTSNCEKSSPVENEDLCCLKNEPSGESHSSEKKQEVSKLTCPFESCHYVSQNQKGINIHISRKHKTDGNKNGKDFKCKKCEKPFSSQSGLTRHETVCDPELSKSKLQFICPKCQNPFALQQTLNRHLKTSKKCGDK